MKSKNKFNNALTINTKTKKKNYLKHNRVKFSTTDPYLHLYLRSAHKTI